MKSCFKIYLYLCCSIFYVSLVKAQINLINHNADVVMNGHYLVLNNTKFINNSMSHLGSGTVIVSGGASTAQSQIGGSSPTTFYNLVINKSANHASIGQHTTITNQLMFSSGKMVIGNYDLTMSNTATISGQNKDRYIQTNGTGSLIQQVGVNWTTFPVGNTTFNPVKLKNDGVLDNFSIRVVDHFLQNGTAGNAITTNVIPRTWLIDEATSGGSDVSMRLIWRPLHHNNNGFDTNNSAITHYTNGTWQDYNMGTSVADNSYNSDHHYREATNIINFSPFGVRSNNLNLPVELLYFYGEQVSEGMQLDWQTATEINNSHFDVEWSPSAERTGINGTDFLPNASSGLWTKIGEVQGAGTTTDVFFYDFLHENPTVGTNYYRLKQIDFDGQFEYTNILSIEYRTSNIEYRIYPNPASDYFNLEAPNAVGEIIQVFNVKGQVVKEVISQSPITNIPITNLTGGTYFVKIGKEVKKLIIAK